MERRIKSLKVEISDTNKKIFSTCNITGLEIGMLHLTVTVRGYVVSVNYMLILTITPNHDRKRNLQNLLLSFHTQTLQTSSLSRSSMLQHADINNINTQTHRKKPHSLVLLLLDTLLDAYNFLQHRYADLKYLIFLTDIYWVFFVFSLELLFTLFITLFTINPL